MAEIRPSTWQRRRPESENRIISSPSIRSLTASILNPSSPFKGINPKTVTTTWPFFKNRQGDMRLKGGTHCAMRRKLSSKYRGVPTERIFYAIRPSKAIGSKNLKPSHSGNSSPVRFRVFFVNVNKQLKWLAMALDQYLTYQIFPVLHISCVAMETHSTMQQKLS